MRAIVLIVLGLVLGGRAEAAEPEAAIDAIVTGYMAREQAPGVAVVAMRGDTVVLARGWGKADVASGRPMTPQTAQPIYSASKHVTAALVLSLGVAADEPVGRRLPEWFGDEPDLRVAHLMRHTSGLPEELGLPGVADIETGKRPGGLAEVMAIVDGAPRKFRPGAWHAYSNTNYTALALVAERAGGEPFERLVRRFSGLEECGPSRARGAVWSTGYDLEGEPWTLPPNLIATYSGPGGICADATGLARWVRALASGRVLAPDRFAQMTTQAPVAVGFAPPYGYGLALKPVAGRRAWSHAGGGDGWGSWFAYLPDEELTVVVMANRGPIWASDIGQPIVRALLGQPEPPPLTRLPLTAAERGALAGRFDDGLFAIGLAAEADRVTVEVKPFGAPIELWKQGPGRFVSPLRPDTFELTLEPGGRIHFDWMEHRSYLRPDVAPPPPQAKGR